MALKLTAAVPAAGIKGIPAVMSAFFTNLFSTFIYDPSFVSLTGAGLSFTGSGSKATNQISLNAELLGQSSSVQGSTTMTLPFKSLRAGFLVLHDAVNNVFIGMATIPANSLICYLPTYTNKMNVSMSGTYTCQAAQ